MTNIVGIDLGTTYSALARVNESGNPEIVPNKRGGNITPSVVEFTSSTEYSVGETAKKNSVAFKNQCVPNGVGEEAKRHMGSTTKIYEIHGEKHTPVSISALILKKFKEDFENVHEEDENGQEVDEEDVYDAQKSYEEVRHRQGQARESERVSR